MEMKELAWDCLRDKDWTFTRLARMSGVSRGSVERFLKTGKGTIDTIESILNALGCEIIARRIEE